MKNKTLMSVSVFMICVLTALSVAACAKTAPEAAQTTKAPIKIALITDYTGIAASQVAMTGWGAEDYFPWVNAKGGIDGHPISCEVIDSKYDVNLIRSTYKRLKDNICSISLDALSGGIAALQADFIKDQMPNLMTTGLGPVLYPPGWIFTTFVPYDDRFAHFGDWVMKNWKEARKPRMAMFIGNVASCKIIDSF